MIQKKSLKLIESMETKVRFLEKDLAKLKKTLEEENMKKADGISHYESMRDNLMDRTTGSGEEDEELEEVDEDVD